MKFGKALELMALTVLLGLTTFNITSCKEEKTDDSKNYEEIGSDVVNYDATGNYEIKVNLPSSLKKEDIKIKYTYFDKAGYEEASKTAVDSSTIDMDRYYIEKDAAINSLLPSSDELAIAFTDSDAKKNFTEAYTLIVESTKQVMPIAVEFKDNLIEADVESVLATAKVIKVTLTNRNGEFKKDIKASDIKLDGSFRNLNIASISNSNKYLTLQLTGDLAYNQNASIYTDGEIILAPNLLLSANKEEKIYIPIEVPKVYVDSSKLDYDNGLFSLPLISNGLVDTKTLEASDIEFEKGVKLERLVNDEEKAYLVFSVEGADTLDKAAAVLDGQNIKVKDNEVVLDFAKASFYPVFDNIEKVGSSFNLKINLYAEAGSFNKNITKDMVSVNLDMGEATVSDLKVVDESVCELNLSIPEKDNKEVVESFKREANIKLAEKALVNNWHTLSEEVSFDRVFSFDNIGKAGNPLDYVNLFLSVASLAISCAGLADSHISDNKMMSQLEENKKLMEEGFRLMDRKLELLDAKVELISVDHLKDFNNTLGALSLDFAQTVNHASNKYLLAKGVAHPEYPNSEYSEAKNKKIDEMWKEYFKKFYAHDYNGIKNTGFFTDLILNSNLPEFTEFPNTYRKIKDKFYDIYGTLDLSLQRLDDAYSKIYNSNVQAHKEKTAFLNSLQVNLTTAYQNILFYNGEFAKDTWGSSCAHETEMYNKMMETIKKRLTTFENVINYKNNQSVRDKNNPIHIYTLHLDLNSVRVQNIKKESQKHPPIVNFDDANVYAMLARKNAKGNMLAEFKEMNMLTDDEGMDGFVVNYHHTKKGKLSGFYYWYKQYYYVVNWNGDFTTELGRKYHAKKGFVNEYNCIFFVK